MQAINNIFENLETLKAEYETLQKQSAFLNLQTLEIIPVKEAAGKNLENFKFVDGLPKIAVDKLIVQKMIDLFNGTVTPSKVSEIETVTNVINGGKLRVVNIKKLPYNKIVILFKILGKSPIAGNYIKYTGQVTNQHLFKGKLSNNQIVYPYKVILNETPDSTKKGEVYTSKRFYMAKVGR